MTQLIKYQIVIMIFLGLTAGRCDAHAERRPPVNGHPQSQQGRSAVSTGGVYDPNTDLAKIIADVSAFFQADDRQAPLNSLNKGQKFWQLPYHPQVSPQTFTILGYPYYPGGTPWFAGVFPPMLQQETEPKTLLNDLNDPNQPDLSGEPIKEDPQTLRWGLEKCCDLIHKWRTFNEAPATPLEIVYAKELTQTATGIYQTAPQLAVNVTRTIGQIGRRNRQFDLLSRMVLRMLLSGYLDKTVLARTEKLMTELETLLERLAEQNNAISIELGIGKINRTPPTADPQEPIRFTMPIKR